MMLPYWKHHLTKMTRKQARKVVVAGDDDETWRHDVVDRLLGRHV